MVVGCVRNNFLEVRSGVSTLHNHVIYQAYFKYHSKWAVGAWTGSSWLRIGTAAGTCGRNNETSNSIKCG